jgi:hypothetical protein
MARSARNTKRPALDLKTLKDAAKLDDVLNEVVAGDLKTRAMSKQVLSLQNRLRRLVDDRGWQTFLKLEELVNGRTWAINVVVARWAFLEGRRARRSGGRRT